MATTDQWIRFAGALALVAATLLPPPAAAADSADPAAASVQTVVVIGAGSDARKPFADMDRSRETFLLPALGATTYRMDSDAIDALPQGRNTPIEKVLLQAPGVSYDSALSNTDLHVRNEYGDLQYRINGIQLPDGVAGLGPVLETAFVGNLELLDGALPAQYGLRTAGVIDISTPSQFRPGGDVSLYTGSRSTLSSSIDYGGVQGRTQYFVTGRYLQNDEGLENAMPSLNAIHDRTGQGKLFGYRSTLLDSDQRLSFIGGASVAQFQIPDNSGQRPLGDFGSPNLNSDRLDENEHDGFAFAVAALQTRGAGWDSQLSSYVQSSIAHFIPDVAGDLAFNDVASDVVRRSLLAGIQFDGAWHLQAAHTLRAGFVLNAEQTHVDNDSTVLPLDASGQPLPQPVTLADRNARLGHTIGLYAQDEWKLNPALTLNGGLRFDAMSQFVNASQLSPRLGLIYQAGATTTVHLGYARYFTPPIQALATPTRLALFAGTVQQPVVDADDPVRPERSHYVDLGVDQQILPGLTGGIDVYYKRATDLLDDGQFGQAVVLTQFNYAQGSSRGLEAKLAYESGRLRAYANVSLNETQARKVVSNQYLFDDAVELAYIAQHDHDTDDDQFVTASAGASWRVAASLLTLDGIYGSGLRSGFANQQHTPAYTQWNAAASREFAPWSASKPLTLRVSVANLFDRRYVLRDGSGIGEFAPQYGPRRGYYLTVSQAL
jgi:outer membrane receptor protein involved in Fe transport